MVTGHAANLQFCPRGELTVEATLNDAVGHTLVVLVTKYHLGWMAYADADHGYLTVDWNWLLDTTRSGSGWPTRAGSWPHEIGHLFHAPMKGHAQLRRRRMARSVVLMDFIRHRGRRLPRPAAGSTEPYD
jgi:hypothetical protein